MPTLPPEVLSSIFELAVPPATFSGFFKRSSNLRAFALVCSGWRQEAQRLLWRDVTMKYPNERDENESTWSVEKRFTALKRLQSRCAVRHVRLSGSRDDRVPPMSALRQTLTALTLDDVLLEPRLLSSLPSLQSLALCQTAFNSFPDPTGPLISLTDLSFDQIASELPACLLPPELPNLKTLAIHSSSFGVIWPSDPTVNSQYSPQDIIDLQPRLEFFSCKKNSLYWRNPLDLIADKTLFDIDQYKPSDKVDFSSVKHVRITDAPLEKSRIRAAKQCFPPPRFNTWNTSTLEDLIEETFPNLETIVAPAGWQISAIYEATKAMLDEHEVSLVLEDKSSRKSGESLISQPFKEHLRRKRAAVANA